MDRITLIKLKEAKDPYHPNNIEEGYERIGTINVEPVVGECFFVLGDHSLLNVWRTSAVQEIIDKNTFRTYNSIYRIVRENTRVILTEKIKF